MMTLPDTHILKQRAAQTQSQHGPQAKRLILLHTGAVLALNILALLLTWLLDWRIESTGGLGDMQIRAALTTAQLTLQFASVFLLPFWQIGWTYVILKFSRGQSSLPADLLMGFRRLGPVLRLTLLKSLIFTGLMVAGIYAGYFMILATPVSAPLTDAMLSTADPEVMYSALMEAIQQIEKPLLLACGGYCLVICIPFFYRFRLAEYYLLDHAELGARTALRASRRMMRGNTWRMVKLDLSFWWFWLLSALAMTVSYGNELLPMAGISLPVSGAAASILAFALFIPCQLLLYRSCKVYVDATYAAAYEALSSPAQPDTSVSFPSIQE